MQGPTVNYRQVCLLLLTLSVVVNCKTKCAIVKGQFECPSDPIKAADIQVYLMDYDGGTFMDPDDTMGLTYSNLDGTFRVEGCGYDWGPWNTPDPYLRIHHYCNHPGGIEIRTRVVKMFNPEILNLGKIHLE